MGLADHPRIRGRVGIQPVFGHDVAATHHVVRSGPVNAASAIGFERRAC